MSMTGKNNPLDDSYRDNKDPVYPHEDRYHDSSEELLDILKEHGYTEEQARDWLTETTTDKKGRTLDT